jgi:hypothetical protein
MSRLIVSIAVVVSCAATAGLSVARTSIQADAGPQPFVADVSGDAGSHADPSARPSSLWDAGANSASTMEAGSSLWDASANQASSTWDASSSLWDAGANRVSGQLRGDSGSR